MGDVGDMWKSLHEEERVRAAERKVKNLETLRASRVPFVYQNGGDIVLIRSKGYPAVDFWPTKNRWRVGTRNMIGSAQNLLDWLKLRAMK